MKLALVLVGVLALSSCAAKLNGDPSPAPKTASPSSAARLLEPKQVCSALSAAEIKAAGLPGKGVRDDYAGNARCRWVVEKYDLDIVIAPNTPLDLRYGGGADFEMKTLDGREARLYNSIPGVRCDHVFAYGPGGNAAVGVDRRSTENAQRGGAEDPCAVSESIARYVLPKVPSATATPSSVAPSDLVHRTALVTGTRFDLDKVGDVPDFVYTMGFGIQTLNGTVIMPTDAQSLSGCSSTQGELWRTSVDTADIRTGATYCLRFPSKVFGLLTMDSYGDPGAQPTGIEISWRLQK
ncbi:Protein of unknown function [Lentzea waywayandensis]|uniref:DUF3558 domain-containing protein n=1 Tax=Lentzea waywayandensis TaxID=84724 RepID=A0A1I6FGW9_9PSEU|nr:DUF3558 family protein [Lentzea waywayandensis]SFR29144.1 Protein of unknown function [Lentzea waywayandensis]